jgi:LPXTG-motif cell wall-anchored protein
MRRAAVALCAGLLLLAGIFAAASPGSFVAGRSSGTMLYSQGRGNASSPAMTPFATAGASGATEADTGATTFFPNVKLPCDQAIAGALIGCGQLLEPEVTSGPDGTIYVTAQEGVPGGVDLWRRDAGTYEYKHVSKPDANEPLTSPIGLALGGGDNDVAVTTDGRVLVASLSLASAPVSYSTDRGESFTKVELANGLPNVDRMWLTTIGKSTVYYAYHDNEISQIWMVKSTDGGETWSEPVGMLPATMLPQWLAVQATVGNVQGDIVADPDGRVIIPFLSSTDATHNATPLGKPNGFYVVVTDANGENPVVHPVYEGDADIMGLFPAVASDAKGNLYGTWTDKHGVFLSISRDHGVTWSKPRTISSGPGNRSTVFPFVIAGSEGRVALAWLGTSSESNNDKTAQWITYFAQSLDALSATPHWTQVAASDHVVHAAAICLDGLACNVTGGDRRLAEVLQMGLTKDGRVLIAYPDSSSVPFGAWSFIAEQRFGPGMYADVTPTPPPPQPVKTPGGRLDRLLSKIGTARFFMTSTGGTVPDQNGATIDTFIDTGGLSPTPGSDAHVAYAGGLTNLQLPLPMTFQTEALKAPLIVGGAMTFTAFISEATSAVASAAGDPGAVTLRLIDVAPTGSTREITTQGAYYDAGVDITKNVFRFAVAKPFLLPKGHVLRAEVSWPLSQASEAAFYYGDEANASGFTIETFSGSLPRTPIPKPRPRVLGGHLPATGVGTPWIPAALILAAAAGLGFSLRRRRG